MVVITLLNIVVVLMAYLSRDEKHRYLLLWAFLLLILVLGIRYGYGNDFFSYKYFFDHGSYEKESEDPDPGWGLLNKLFKPFGFSSMVFFLTVVEHLMLYDIIRRYIHPNYYWLALFIYLFNPYFMLIGLSMMRQFLVQILGFYAMEYAYKRKLLIFVLIVLICISIHKVGFLLVPLYLFSYVSKVSTKNMLLLAFLPTIIAIVLMYVKMDLIIERLIELFGESGMKYGDSYLNSTVLSEEYRVNPKMVLRYVLYFVLLIRNYNFLPNSNASRLFAIEVTLGVLFIPFASISPMAIRVSWIYSMVVIIAMPFLIEHERSLKIRNAVMLVFSILLLRDYYNHFFSDIWGAQYLKFYTIFSEYAIYDIRLF